jgi:hypothetical protein
VSSRFKKQVVSVDEQTKTVQCHNVYTGQLIKTINLNRIKSKDKLKKAINVFSFLEAMKPKSQTVKTETSDEKDKA